MINGKSIAFAQCAGDKKCAPSVAGTMFASVLTLVALGSGKGEFIVDTEFFGSREILYLGQL